MSSSPKQILILGGGFAGVYTARALEKLLRPDEATITLVNRENYWVYQPMLSEVISGSIGVANVVSPIRRLCPRTNLVTREIEEIDLAGHIVTVSPGFRPRQLKLHYDYLVIALGNVTNFYGMPGMFENAFAFKTLADAMLLRNHVIRTLEEADVEEDPELRRKLLTFVVGGGGFSGVEVIAELNEFIRAVKRNYLRLRSEPHRCVLVHSRNRILQEMAEPLALFAQKTLRKRGVEIILEDRLVAATSEKAILKSGAEIPAKTIVCTVPSTLPPVIQKLDCPKDKGKLLTNTGLELKDHEGQVWALGDCASVKTVAGSEAPPTAQHAIREATTAAINIAAAVREGSRGASPAQPEAPHGASRAQREGPRGASPAQPEGPRGASRAQPEGPRGASPAQPEGPRGASRAQFAFEGLGTLGSLGHGAAVAQILGVKLSGFLAWFLWRCIYLSKMPGLNRKARIASDWTLHLLFPPDLAQTKLEPESGIQNQHFEPGDVIFQQGDLGDSVYVIEQGECDVLSESNGDRQLLATLKAGDYFGEMALLSDQTRNATIQARTAMSVLIIPKDDFNKLRHSVPAFAEVFRELARKRAGSQAPALNMLDSEEI